MMRSDSSQNTRLVTEPPMPHTRGERLGTLTMIAGPDVGAFVVIPPSGLLVGRDDVCDLRVPATAVSRKHFRIHWQDDRYVIEDLASTNGTWVGDARIRGSIRLRHGMRIRIGGAVLRFAMQDEIERESSMRLYEMSVRDALTGLYNRRHLDERLRIERTFAARQRAPLSVLALDVDHLKEVNDLYGHQAGDAVLQAIGAALQNATRAEDVVARMGGDEFVVLARVAAEGARSLGERLRSRIADLRIVYGGVELATSVSIGIAWLRTTSTPSETVDLMAAADVALYAAKRAGRNQIEETPASPSSDPAEANGDVDPSRNPTRAEN